MRWKKIVPYVGAAIVAAILIILVMYRSAIPKSGIFVPELSILDSKMTEIMDRYDFPGGALAVVREGKLVYARGFGYADEEAREVVSPDSLFRIASVSKVITGMAMSRLIQEGIVSLDDKVFGETGILNDAIYKKVADVRMKDIKVWHLLTHTSGFYGETGYDPQYDYVNIASKLGSTPPATNVDVIRYVLSQGKLEFAPGSKYLYSNVGYNILGRIIEKKTGTSYDEYVRGLLRGIGITDMQIAGSLEEDRRPGEVKYYDMPWCVGDKYDGSGEKAPCSYGTIYFPTADSHGGWIASTIDLLKMLAAIDGFGLRNQLLSAGTIETLKRSPKEIRGAHAFNGWSIDADDNWSHSGALGTGTLAYLSRRADQTELAVVFNLLPVKENVAMEDILSILNDITSMEADLSAITVWPDHDLFDEH